MNQTGVTSTDSRRQARRKRSFTSISYYDAARCPGGCCWDRPHIHARIARLSPIFLRPIREQSEHDRVVRQLQARWRRRFSVVANPGAEREGSVRLGSQILHPDLILSTTEGGRRLHALVEVETAESVNHLEAMAQWAHYAKVRGAFYLYLPVGLADAARRLCEANKINVTEIWTYYIVGGQVRFAMSYRSPRATQSAKAKVGARTKRTRKASKAKTSKKSSKSKKPAKAKRQVRARTIKPSSKPKTKKKTTKKKSTEAPPVFLDTE